MPDVTDFIVEDLVCPLDETPLTQVKNSLSCASGHSFDIASSGYVNVLGVQHKRSKDPGDSKEMIAARRDFLNQGFYQPIAAGLATSCDQHGITESSKVVDAGCGDGYYLAYLLDHLQKDSTERAENFTGVDISKWAIAAAAKRSSLVRWIVGSNKQPIFSDKSQDLIISMFGFNQWANFSRMLKDDGLIILIEPEAHHIIELRELLYNSVNIKSPPALTKIADVGLEVIDEQVISFSVKLNEQQNIHRLLTMTPHFYRAPREGKERATAIDQIELTAEISLKVIRKTG